jgi:hypothetical protein
MPHRRGRHACVRLLLRSAVIVLAASSRPDLVFAQTRAALAAAGEAPPPSAPEVVSRDDAGHVTVRAVRVTEAMKIDGSLDERIYAETRAITAGKSGSGYPHRGNQA